MDVFAVQHPVVGTLLHELRDQETTQSAFQRCCTELSAILAYEATAGAATKPREGQSPVSHYAQDVLAQTPLLVPVLRAGLGMLSGVQRWFGAAEIGVVGMVRDEETLVASSYTEKLPSALLDRDVMILDPMLATGGTMAHVAELCAMRGARSITLLCLVCAPEGIGFVRAKEASGAFGDARLSLYTAAIDDALNAKGYITPGLGDAGDRLFGTLPQ